MPLQGLVAELPLVTGVLGTNWLKEEEANEVPYIEARLPWYKQLEEDLKILLKAGIAKERITSCYRSSLRNRDEVEKSIYEVHGAAFMASCATGIDVHVRRGDATSRNFDVLAEIEGYRICAESKTRKDAFPFNMPEIVDDGINIGVFGGSRATLDPHDAGDLELSLAPAQANHRATPESTVVRQILLEGLAQLPQEGCNIILFGQIEGDLINFVDALAGSEYVEARKNSETGQITHHWVRARNGAFNSSDTHFESLSAVLWMRLWCDGDKINKAYRGYLNPKASTSLPDQVVASLTEHIERTSSLEDGR